MWLSCWRLVGRGDGSEDLCRDGGKGDQEAMPWQLHVLRSGVPRRNVRPEEYVQGARHGRCWHSLSEQVGGKACRVDVLQRHCPSSDVLPCVVQVDVEVLDPALVGVAVAEADECSHRGPWRCRGEDWHLGAR